MTDLLQQHCQHRTGAAMGDAEVQDHLAQVPTWHHTDTAIAKTFKFKNFHETMAFVDALAWIAHREDHHPELEVSYGSCLVRFSTHSVGGLSANDFICAARADALVSLAG